MVLIGPRKNVTQRPYLVRWELDGEYRAIQYARRLQDGRQLHSRLCRKLTRQMLVDLPLMTISVGAHLKQK